MRIPTAALIAVVTVTSTMPALAQSTGPTSVNKALSQEGQARAAQQNQVSKSDTQMMNSNRNQMSAPSATGPTAPIIGHAKH